MSLIRENIKSLQQADKELEDIAKKAIVENMDFILFLLKEKQIKQSIKSDGSTIGKSYSEATESHWRYVDPPRSREQFDYKVTENTYDLDWSGSWLNQMYIKVEKDGFDILSRDRKQSFIEQVAGGKVNALTEENNEKVNDEIIKPALFEHFIDRLLYF